MKLLLHWLRWDLRRFRWPLLAWVVLLSGFTLFLWHLNARLLSVNPLLVSMPDIIASVLGILEVFLLVPILSADPAVGARSFWKTRPPAGLAVAGARSVLVLTFFLLLPMLAWWIVLKFSGFGFARARCWKVGTWMEFIVWAEALGISALALAASAARSVGHTVGRLLAGFLVLCVPVLFSMPFWEEESRAAGLIESASKAVIEGVYNMRMPLVWLLAGPGIFLLARRHRVPGPWIRSAPFFMPLLVALVGGVLPAAPEPVAAKAPPLDVQVSGRIKVGTPLLRSGLSPAGPVFGGRMGGSGAKQTWRFNLHLSGLPEDRTVLAKWREVSLVSPGGRRVSARPEIMGGDVPVSRDGVLSVTPVVFSAPELTALSLDACRAKGVLSLLVRQRHSRELPIRNGETIEASGTVMRLTEVNPEARPKPGGMGNPMFTFTAEVFDCRFEPEFRLEQTATGRRLSLRVSDTDTRSGYFIARGLRSWRVNPVTFTPMLNLALFRRDVARGRLEDWHLRVEWNENEGTMELPVVLDPVIIRRQPGDERKAEDILDAFTLPAGASKEEVWRQTMHALGLIEASGLPVPLDSPDPLIAALDRFLAKVPRQHLDVLLRIAGEERPGEGAGAEQRYPFDGPLRRRIAELLTSEDLPALRARPWLFAELRSEPGLLKFLPPNGDEFREADAGTTRLQQAWEDSRDTVTPAVSALEGAARRGLSWVPGAIAELLDLLPESGEALFVHNFMHALSDCPQASGAGVDWLRKNAARLAWDADRKRWVLP